jgi:hypothetical protein
LRVLDRLRRPEDQPMPKKDKYSTIASGLSGRSRKVQITKGAAKSKLTAAKTFILSVSPLTNTSNQPLATVDAFTVVLYQAPHAAGDTTRT